MTAVATTDDDMVIIYTWWKTPYGKDGQKICHTISYGDFKGMVTPDDDTGKWRATVARTGALFDDVEMARRHVEETIQRLLDAGATIDALDANGDSPLSWASWHTRPDAILRKLCYGTFHVRSGRNSAFDHGVGWGFMEKDLLGKP